jgi:hypothetical protein
MSAVPYVDHEATVLRWGGLAGIVGSALFLLVFVIVGVFVGSDPEPEGAVMRFPDIRMARTVENGLYLLVLSLWAVHFLALFRTLQGTSLAAAMFGSALGILGLAVLAVGAIPHAASVPISDLYHAPGTSPEDQATLVLVWQATYGIFNALLVTGLVIMPLSLFILGVGMLDAPAFGKGHGWATVILGVVGAAAAVALLVNPQSFIAVVGILALIAFHLIMGWKVYRLSRLVVSSTAGLDEGAAARIALQGR